MNVVILHDVVGERADEADVLVQAAAVTESMSRLGHRCRTLAVGPDLAAGARALQGLAPDLVFNLVESLGGSGRLIASAPLMVETLGIRYTGAPADAIHLTSNKVLAKRIMAMRGVPTPMWWDARALRSLAGAPGRETGNGGAAPPGSDRVIVKSVWEHASIGLDEDSVLAGTAETSAEGWLSELNRRRDSLGGEGFVESYVDGREFNLSLLADGLGGVEVLPVAEIEFRGYEVGRARVVGYRAKWESDSFEYHHTPRRFAPEAQTADSELAAAMTRIARDCWGVFGLRGYARVDFRVDDAGSPWVLEINTNPCLSPDAGFAAAVGAAGLTMDDAVRRIVDDALIADS